MYPQQRRRVNPTVAIVLVTIATVLAGGGAYFGARAYLDAQPADSVSQPPTRPGTGAATNTADPCPGITIRALKDAGRPGQLERLLYVDVTRANSKPAEAWICRDSDGVLYYQGHVKDGLATAATSANTILLGKGIKGEVSQNGTTFTANNPSPGGGSTRYIVNARSLTLIEGNGNKIEYTVVRASP